MFEGVFFGVLLCGVVCLQVLGMDPLPTQQKVFRRDRSARKRRRSGGEQADSESMTAFWIE